jgi:hypothetical protein
MKKSGCRLQEESEESYFPLAIYPSECPSCSSQFFMYRLANFLSLIMRRFSALFSEFPSWEYGNRERSYLTQFAKWVNSFKDIWR